MSFSFLLKAALLLSILLITCKLTSAQSCIPENSHYMDNWYFGNSGGLKFNNYNNPPTVLTNGKINQREGCASISDANGNLLFYTDGQTVYNKKHNLMTNGSNLNGHPSSTQSAIICPMPGNKNRFYIFTCGYMLESVGIQYSVVDMSLDNGDGAIIDEQKNILIYRSTNSLGNVEKLAATYHSNSSDIWLIYHEFNNNSFVSLKITSQRIENPIKSNIGPIISSNWDATGYMKFSRSSTKLAVTLGGSSQRILMLDFNNTNGILSNANYIVLPPNFTYCYGLEFSPNHNYLYVSTMNNTALNSYSSILQYNMQLGNYITISKQAKVIALSNTINYGALQLGPDGIIYSAKENGVNNGNSYLGTISSPNSLGQDSKYVENAIDLKGKFSLIGLPTFLNPIQNCTLPLKIIDFHLMNDNPYNTNTLYWTIEDPSEINTLVLEKSADGLTFEDILILNNPPSQYSYEDKSINNSPIYYRLKIISINNSISHSKLVNSNKKIEYEIEAYPNPIQNILNISNSNANKEEKILITLLNNKGNIVYQSTITINNNDIHQINTSMYPDGMYILKIQNNDHINTQKLIKISQ